MLKNVLIDNKRRKSFDYCLKAWLKLYLDKFRNRMLKNNHEYNFYLIRNKVDTAMSTINRSFAHL